MVGPRKAYLRRFNRLFRPDSQEVVVRCDELLQAIYGVASRPEKNLPLRTNGDAHTLRVLRRLGLSSFFRVNAAKENVKRGQPRTISALFLRRLRLHASKLCSANRPKCDKCPLVSFCSFGIKRAVRSARAKPLAIDLCAGAGALSAGFRREGFHVVLAVEREKHAAQSYRVNNPGVPVLEADVREINPLLILELLGLRRGEITAVIAGPPCQGYSVAGPRKPRAERNFLFQSIVHVAKGLDVGTLVMENVPGLSRVGGVSFKNRILKCMRTAGYKGSPAELDASDFGVPQRRKRIIFVCARRHDISLFAIQRPNLPTKPTVKRAFRTLPPPNTGRGADEHRTRGKLILNHRAMAHSTKVIQKIKKIRPGKGPLSYRRLSSKLAHTLIAGHRAMPVHPHQNRTITVREAARLQTLPDTFRFLGPHSEQPLQVANAVPYLLSRAIARSLLAWLKIALGQNNGR
jgi:DNA (cytosine-5)-methyltransferase 1